jgi:UDP-glucose 4-epimerase
MKDGLIVGNSRKIFITGANGFLGSYLAGILRSRGHNVLMGARASSGDNYVPYGNAEWESNWQKILSGVDCIVHCAARVHHKSQIASEDEWRQYKQINVEATKRLAERAVFLGIKRFIYISTIKVNGERTDGEASFVNTQQPCPEDLYAKSKWMAENELWAISKASGLEVVIIRPPLIYGPHAKGNLRSLINLVSKGVPLPFGSISNKRSFISVDNLSGLVNICVTSAVAPGNVYLASDGADLSTPELISYIGVALNKDVRLINIPLGILNRMLALVGFKKSFYKLTESLVVNIEYTRNHLGWNPKIHPIDAMKVYFGKSASG